MEKKFLRKTYNVTVVPDAQAKELFDKARKVYQCDLKGVSVDEDRTQTFVISTANPDRSKDVVVPTGVKLDHYLNNPIVAAFHKYDRPSIGRTIQVGITDNEVVAKMEFTHKGDNPEADVLYELYKKGFQRAVSIGFSSENYKEREGGGTQFNEWELYEYSAVLIPDNPEALAKMKTKGLDTDAILKEQEENAEKPNLEVGEDVKPEVEEQPVKIDDTPERVEEVIEDAIESEKTLRIEKGVSEVVALASLASELDWYIYAFGQNGVEEGTLSKLTQSLSLLMEAVKEQATLEQQVTKEKGINFVKAGRTLSSKNEGLIKSAHDNLTSVLSSLEKETGKDDKGATVDNAFLLSLQKSLRTTDKEVGLALRLIKAREGKQKGEEVTT